MKHTFVSVNDCRCFCLPCSFWTPVCRSLTRTITQVCGGSVAWLCVRESQNLRELASLHPANALFPGERDGEGQEERLQRLAFESEVVDDVERSVQLHKQLIVLAEKRKDKKIAVLWCSLARMLLRHGEHRVEEAEQALWESIRAQGSAEKASEDTWLMLGSCCLHRKRYKDAEMAFASAVRRCGETEKNAKTPSLSVSPPVEGLSPSLSLSLGGGVGWHSGSAREHESGESRQEKSACSDNASARSSPASTMAPQVLPFFFLSVCHYLAGDTASFEKYLALAFKPAAFFENERDLNAPPDDESEEENPGNEKSGEDTQTSCTNPAWPEGIFDELEEMVGRPKSRILRRRQLYTHRENLCTCRGACTDKHICIYYTPICTVKRLRMFAWKM
ncbi:tetratricopeptide repeat-containing protein [Toxoplasma gondii ARI]|uniref:Tetratricopeptide repeat-containing protein n=1 Tax=Toxoplasma gondii ARI TaxID=1074872 RepID=A0A139Y1D6_TOXGO|nr:tetratricopeptide repeat-containing protein [Toxoplasma gondii ARI]